MLIEPGLEPIVDAFLKSEKKHIGHALGIELIELSRNKVVGKMPVDDRTHQPFGILHGGASVVLAETLASIGSWLNLEDSSKMAVGLEINANHIKAVRTGWVIGTATPIHKGTQTQVWSIEIKTESESLVCVSRCTLAVVNKR
ncbi:hotdog fold thioesterase [bacterium]|nr:MAG: hotdog fold thioesterase [bacterium]